VPSALLLLLLLSSPEQPSTPLTPLTAKNSHSMEYWLGDCAVSSNPAPNSARLPVVITAAEVEALSAAAPAASVTASSPALPPKRADHGTSS